MKVKKEGVVEVYPDGSVGVRGFHINAEGQVDGAYDTDANGSVVPTGGALVELNTLAEDRVLLAAQKIREKREGMRNRRLAR